MVTRGIRLAGLTLALGVWLAPAARADTRFDVRIGIPGSRVAAPYRYERRPPAGFWRPGHYVWSGYRRHWVPGRWVRPVYEYRRPFWRDERGAYDRGYGGERWRDRGWRR